MKEIVLKSTIEDERSKRRAMKAVASVGVDSIAVDIKGGKITVVGDSDPVWLTTKLRKMGFRAELVSVGPVKEKKEEKKGEDPAKDEKKDAEKKKQEQKAAEPAPAPTVVYVDPTGYGHYNEGYAYHVVREEYPSICTIS